MKPSGEMAWGKSGTVDTDHSGIFGASERMRKVLGDGSKISWVEIKRAALYSKNRSFV